MSLLSAAALLVHGYHQGAEDGAVYLPAVFKSMHPGLYPFGDEFFLAHSHFSLFANAVGLSARLTRLSDSWTIFLWHLASIFAYLLAGRQLANLCSLSPRARWSALLTLATTMTIPIAGTATVIMDPYVTARSISTPLTLLAIASWLGGQRWKATLWIGLAILVHPLIALFGAAAIVSLQLTRAPTKVTGSGPAGAFSIAVVPGGFTLRPAAYPYSRTLAMRHFLFPLQWHWYEWIGVATPLVFLSWCTRVDLRGMTPAFGRVSRAMLNLGVVAALSGILLSSTPRLETFVRLQPMRCFQIIYVLFFLLLGSLLGEFVLRSSPWRWLLLFLASSSAIFLVQQDMYPASLHVEWPGVAPRNAWLAAFEWIRCHTPKNAVFALDPNYIRIPGEDQHGFRALAQRSSLADAVKDSGVVSLLPELAPEWEQQQEAQLGWERFKLPDFERLSRLYPVSWVVLQTEPPAGLECPYKNEVVYVCHIPGAVGLPPTGPRVHAN